MERLFREAESDVSLRVTETDSPDAFWFQAEGNCISILIEKMRREGYEFEVSRPRVIEKVINGLRCEPIMTCGRSS